MIIENLKSPSQKTDKHTLEIEKLSTKTWNGKKVTRRKSCFVTAFLKSLLKIIASIFTAPLKLCCRAKRPERSFDKKKDVTSDKGPIQDSKVVVKDLLPVPQDSAPTANEKAQPQLYLEEEEGQDPFGTQRNFKLPEGHVEQLLPSKSKPIVDSETHFKELFSPTSSGRIISTEKAIPEPIHSPEVVIKDLKRNTTERTDSVKNLAGSETLKSVKQKLEAIALPDEVAQKHLTANRPKQSKRRPTTDLKDTLSKIVIPEQTIPERQVSSESSADAQSPEKASIPKPQPPKGAGFKMTLNDLSNVKLKKGSASKESPSKTEPTTQNHSVQTGNPGSIESGLKT